MSESSFGVNSCMKIDVASPFLWSCFKVLSWVYVFGPLELNLTQMNYRTLT